MKKYVYIVGLGIIGMLTVFLLPIWQIQKIEVNGVAYYTETQLKESISFKEGMHSLRLRKDKLVEELKQLTYIKEVTVDYGFPNQLTLQVTERKPLGYVRFLDSYLCIDEEGYVIEQGTEKRLPLPELEGLDFEQFKIGEKLELKNSEQLLILREIIMVLNKYKFTQEVDIIQVSNIQQIHLYVDRLNVIIGNIRDFDKKVRYLIEVHEQYAMGILDLSLIEYKQAILKPMS
ncbi:MAG: cell division protein FtsQ/DivIB [Cellulosilyticaceae bacterium]